MESEQADATEEISRLQHAMVQAMIDGAPSGWVRLERRSVVGVRMASTDSRAVMPDGSQVRFSQGFHDDFRLRDLQAARGTGAWFTLDATVEQDGRYALRWDDAAEPEIGSGDCAWQLSRFPRDPEHVPGWLRGKLRQYLVVSAPDLGWLDAPAGHLSLQDFYTADGQHDNGYLDEAEPTPEEIAQRLAMARRIAETLSGRGVPALAEVEHNTWEGETTFQGVAVRLTASQLDLAVLVDAASVFLVVNRDDGEHVDHPHRITHRETFVLMRHAHEAVQEALGWLPTAADSIAEYLLAMISVDEQTAVVRASTRRTLGVDPVVGADAEERRALACPSCGWFEADVDQGHDFLEICPACGFQPGHHDRGGAALITSAVTSRAWWVLDGTPWRSADGPPAGWDPVGLLEQQLAAAAERRG